MRLDMGNLNKLLPPTPSAFLHSLRHVALAQVPGLNCGSSDAEGTIYYLDRLWFH